MCFLTLVIEQAYTWVTLKGLIVNTIGVRWDILIRYDDIENLEPNEMTRCLTRQARTSLVKHGHLTSHPQRNSVVKQIWLCSLLTRGMSTKWGLTSFLEPNGQLTSGVIETAHLTLVWNKWRVNWSKPLHFCCLILLHSWDISTHIELIAICMQRETH